ncbi:hypothetical protein [Marinitenerispora sediminis]|uniref:hypothetical protein n=1 Tax=Marinitenerispora sediminis TaxID=1931232 RepID=UPI0015F132AC|nr:hypothetical protein [Marinitenerispora sediminis]
MTAAVLDIVGCGVLSPAGSGLDPLAAALAAPEGSAGARWRTSARRSAWAARG